MGFKKVKSKSVFLLMNLCSVASFSLLHADNLKECESEEDKKAGCIFKQYYDNGNLKVEIPYKNGVIYGIGKVYYESGNLGIEIPYTNDKVNGVVKFYDEEKNLFGKQPHKMGILLVGNALMARP